jgi:hypothetical protein
MDRAMDVAAENANDLPVPLDQGAQCLAVATVLPVHIRQPGEERRVMHHQNGRPIGRIAQAGVEPRESPLAQKAGVLAGDRHLQATLIRRNARHSGPASIS